MQRKLIFSGIGLMFFVFLAGCANYPKNIKPITNFEKKRFEGRWYEVARLANSLEQDFADVTADYKLNDDGDFDVVFFNRHARTGEETEVKSIVSSQGKGSVGYLKASVLGPFYISFILYQVDPDYNYAFLCSSSGKEFWLLSKTPAVSSDVLKKFKDSVVKRGYSLDALIMVEQAGEK
jgi:apolipoprotein D and lipocalin family protein